MTIQVGTHQNYEDRSLTGGFLSSYRVVCILGSVVKLQEMHTANNKCTFLLDIPMVKV